MQIDQRGFLLADPKAAPPPQNDERGGWRLRRRTETQLGTHAWDRLQDLRHRAKKKRARDRDRDLGTYAPRSCL